MTDKLTELYENKLFMIRELLPEIVETGLKVCDKYFRRNKHIVLNVYASYFQRFIYSLDSVDTLLQEIEINKPFRCDSITLILRASLLDFLTILYLKSYYEEINTDANKNEQNYDSEFRKLLSSQIRRSLMISHIDKESKNYNQDSFKDYVDIVFKNCNYLFKPGATIDYNNPAASLIDSKPSDDIKTINIRKRLQILEKQGRVTNHIHIYSLYDLFSKHDHFGMISILYQWMDLSEKLENIFWSFYYIVDGISFSMEHLRQDEDIENEYKLIREQCGHLKGVVFTKSLFLSDEYKNKEKK